MRRRILSILCSEELHLLLFGVLFVVLGCTSYKPSLFAGIEPSLHEGSNGNSSVRVLLLIAHPGDEAVFFGPTLAGLTGRRRWGLKSKSNTTNTTMIPARTRTPYEVYALCLSSGDAEGKGEVRKDELNASLNVLGVPEGRRWVLDGPFKENKTQFWDANQIAEYVQPYIDDNQIDIILTFNDRGLSSHPNHISLMRGAAALVEASNSSVKYSSSESYSKSHNHDRQRPLRAFALKGGEVLAKHTVIVPAAYAHLRVWLCRLQHMLLLYRGMSQSCKTRMETTFLGGINGDAVAIDAAQKHRSLEEGWRGFCHVFSRATSRYMNLNEWVEIKKMDGTTGKGKKERRFWRSRYNASSSSSSISGVTKEGFVYARPF